MNSEMKEGSYLSISDHRTNSLNRYEAMHFKNKKQPANIVFHMNRS